MTFAQRRNPHTTHFSERIRVVKRRMTVFCFVYPSVHMFELEEFPVRFPLNLVSVVIETSCDFHGQYIESHFPTTGLESVW